MSVEAVLLDVGGVFVLPDDEVLLPIVHRAGRPDATLADLALSHYEAIAAMDRIAWDRGVTADWPLYNKAMAAALGIPEAADDLGASFVGMRWRRVIPESVAALPRLAATGVHLGIVSNSDGTVEQQLVDAGICQVGPGSGVEVKVIVDSYVVGIEKPDPAIFHHALSFMGVEPGDAVHVGDTGWADIAGARAAGLRPVHFDPYGLCPVPEDHEHVAALEGLVDLVTH